MVEYVGPRDLVLDGQSVSGDTDQSSIDLTDVNKEANTQTWLRSARSTADNEVALPSQR